MKKLRRALSVLTMLSMLFSFLGGAASAEVRPASEVGGYIVKLSAAPEESALRAAGLEEISAGQRLYRYAGIDGIGPLLEQGFVEYIEPDLCVTQMGAVNDTYYEKQWNLSAIDVEAAWGAGASGAGVRVGIIDSGLNLNHEDFEGVSIEKGYNELDGSSNVTDYSGHGSFVSGIIAARINNGKGIAGITDAVTLVPVKCFSRSDKTNVSYIIGGIYKAVADYHCDVINLSLGLEEDLRAFRDAILYAVDQGVIVVSAAGNEGGSQLMYPAAYDNVVGVGSVGMNGGVSEFSERNASVFVSAPGENILSIGYKGSEYASGSGTSFAAPHVTAMAAIAKSFDPGIGAEEFKELLMKSASDRGEAGYDNSYGYGMINMAAFIRLLTKDPATATVFSDVEGHWALEYIRYCIDKGLFTGTSPTTFEPDTAMTRGMLVTVLWRMAGSPALPDAGAGYADVHPDAWYAPAVAWASVNGLVTGFEDGSFRPSDNITREQTAAILYRYELMRGGGSEGECMQSLPYSDADSVADWAYEAVAWCSREGIMNGLGENRFEAQGNASRAQIAAVLQRYIERNSAEG